MYVYDELELCELLGEYGINCAENEGQIEICPIDENWELEGVYYDA